MWRQYGVAAFWLASSRLWSTIGMVNLQKILYTF